MKILLSKLPKSIAIRCLQMLRLRSVLPTVDALRVVCRTTRDRSHLSLLLKQNGRRISLRANTSDIKCLEKVFIDREYRLPSEINPRFNINPRLIIDAGANIGMASLYFSREFPNAKIYAIEPDEENFKLLRKNCEGIPNIKPMLGALWPSHTNLQIVDPSVDNWLFTVRAASEVQGSVNAITVPDILAESGMERIDLLKLDIEGAEFELFSESCEGWLPKINVIVIELHDRFQKQCGRAFYSQISRRPFSQEISGENIFVALD